MCDEEALLLSPPARRPNSTPHPLIPDNLRFLFKSYSLTSRANAPADSLVLLERHVHSIEWYQRGANFQQQPFQGRMVVSKKLMKTGPWGGT
jgi:hypothetical protein